MSKKLEIGQRVWCAGFVNQHGRVVGQSAEVNEQPTMIRVQLERDKRTLTLPRAQIGPEIPQKTTTNTTTYTNRRK